MLSLLLAAFNGWSLARLIDLGSYVGALCMLLGCWRLMSGSNEAIEDVHMMQKIENLEAQRMGRPVPHTSVVPMFLSSGPMAFGGLAWLVLLQAIRYGFGIVLV